jgi:DNA-binding NtrC family response regulator
MARLLLIDDDQDLTFALRTLLGRNGHHVTVAHGAAEATSALEMTQRSSEPAFDVAFLDLTLPDCDGLQLLDRLLTIDPLLPTLCLTGRQDTSAVVNAIRRGAIDYLTKPVARQTLFDAIAAAAALSAARRAGLEARLPDSEAVVGTSVGESPAWKRTLELLKAAAAAPKTTVLLTGEPGSGKEVAATLLHRWSSRRTAPLVTANAACFSQSLMESELFGHEVGAFTGAVKRRRGLFEQADGGILFLDELGELPLDLQSKLLRVLEGHPFRRLGGEEPVSCDTRLVCATNRDLADEVRKGRFRADLLERLRVFELRLPPLRERRQDIPHLAHHFIVKLGRELGVPPVDVAPEVLDCFAKHNWPGNVRELRNVIERALVLSSGERLSVRHLPLELSGVSLPFPPIFSPDDKKAVSSESSASLDAMTRRHIESVFAATGGNVTHTAERLGISRLALRKKLQSYGLRPVRS